MNGWACTETLADGRPERMVSARSLMPLCVVDGALVHAWLEFAERAPMRSQARIRLSSGAIDPKRTRHIATAIDGTPWLQSAAPGATPDLLPLRAPRPLWWQLRDARLLTLRIPIQGQGLALASFDLTGLPRTWLSWDRSPVARRRWRQQRLERAGQAVIVAGHPARPTPPPSVLP